MNHNEQKAFHPYLWHVGVALVFLGVLVIKIASGWVNPSALGPSGFAGITRGLQGDTFGIGLGGSDTPLNTLSVKGGLTLGGSYLSAAAPAGYALIERALLVGTSTGFASLVVSGGGISIDSVASRLQSSAKIPQDNRTTTLGTSMRSPGDFQTSITIAPDGLPVIASWQSFGSDEAGLQIWKCSQIDCSDTGSNGNTVTAFDVASSDVGMHASIAIGQNGFPIASYFDATDGELKFAQCNDANCFNNSFGLVTNSSAPVQGRYSSLMVGSDGFPVIAYWAGGGVGGGPRYVKCHDASCGSRTFASIAPFISNSSNVSTGMGTSLALSIDGFPIVSYFKETAPGSNTRHLNIARCSDLSCNISNVVTTVDSSICGSGRTAISIGLDGFPVVAYADYGCPFNGSGRANLKVLKCSDIGCSDTSPTGNKITTIDTASDIELGDISIGPEGKPIVAYRDKNTGSGVLKVLKCGTTDCTKGNVITTVDATSGSGGFPSVAIGADGLPIISHMDTVNMLLKVTHCGAENCVPFWTRR